MASKVKSADKNVDTKSNEAILKQRVKELEEEVSSLKRRLDELRKAKNTTVVKREREILEVGNPLARRHSKTIDEKELDRLLSEKDKDWQKEVNEMKKKFAAELEMLKKKTTEIPDKNSTCNHETELEFLQQRNEVLENENVAIMTQNRELRDRVFVLMSDLNVKEAKWCEMEEKFKSELQRSWGEKYKQWMDSTEAKISDLQRTNALLRTYVKDHKPTGQDPSGQEPDFDHL
ncbi:chromosome-associated kinesin KIF4 [Biomphalaria glabrata]|nr:chromosome-associated kinesin KIF4 [Biomphalaria glabrata]